MTSSLRNTIRNAAAKVFSVVEPVRPIHSAYCEAIGRIAEATSAQELEDAGHFVHQKGILGNEVLAFSAVPILEKLYVARASHLHDQAHVQVAKAGKPKDSSMEQWFAAMAAKAQQATALEAIPSLPKKIIRYDKATSLFFETMGRLHRAEVKANEGHRTRDHIDIAGTYIIKSDVRSLVGVEKCALIVERYHDVADKTRRNMMQHNKPEHQLPRSLSEIQAHYERQVVDIAQTRKRIQHNAR